MIDVKSIYENDGWGWSDYQPMIDAFGNVAVQVDDQDYQGDTRVLYDNNGKIGHLVFGWGSCSGCDALQACDDYEELQELCNELENDIKWFDNKKEALEWFKAHDWEGDYSWHQEESRDFVKKAIAYLSEMESEQSDVQELEENINS